MTNSGDASNEPSAEVKRQRPQNPEEARAANMEALMENMEALAAHLGVRPQRPGPGVASLPIFNPNDPNSDINTWCDMAEMIVQRRQLIGVPLLLEIAHAFEGAADYIMPRFDTPDIDRFTFAAIRPILKREFTRRQPLDDHFENILTFEIGETETAPEAAVRLWDRIERIPRLELREDIIAGFVIAILRMRDETIAEALRSREVNTKAELLRILGRLHNKRESNGQAPEQKRSRVPLTEDGVAVTNNADEATVKMDQSENSPSNGAPN